MKITGIICEYNPLHNGHLRHIALTRQAGATHIVCILSSNFVQRGDAALLDKLERARLAIRAGADLVLELPAAYTLSSAEGYAQGAVSLLRQLGCVDALSFGCEAGSRETLERAADVSLEVSRAYPEEMQALLRKGISYPAAAGMLTERYYGKEIAGILRCPNNVLGVEYIKALRRQNASITPLCILREGAFHDSGNTSGALASASFIRRELAKGNQKVLSYVPDFTAERLERCTAEGKTASLCNLERILLYRVRTLTWEEAQTLPDMTRPLWTRLSEAGDASSLPELLSRIKSKNCTLARVRRVLLCALIGIRREDAAGEVPYGRILAMNRRGTEILGLARGRLPLGTSLVKLRKAGGRAERTALLEERAADIYGLARTCIGSAAEELRAKIAVSGSQIVKNAEK